MIDINLLRYKIEILYKKLFDRNFLLKIKNFKNQENKRKKLQIKIENLKHILNLKSKKISLLKKNLSDFKLLKENAIEISKKIKIIELKLKTIKFNIENYISLIPNIPDDTTPKGNKNLEIFKWGIPKQYKYPILNHIEIGKILNGIDFTSAAKVTGSRFTILKGQLSTLYRALSQFMLNLHIKNHGYEEYYVPYIVNKNSLYNTGQLPKFSKDLFEIKYKKNKNNSYYLIPTAEVPLINIFKNKIINEKDLPIKMTSCTPCFRYENMSYGKDNQGLIRLYQFDKVELVQIVSQENSCIALENITSHAEYVLQLLNLPYRKVLICAQELSFSSSKTYDLEVWLPSQKIYKEISSCSNTKDFQSRRMKSKYCNFKNKKNYFLHTLNGSALALGRTLAAIIENNQLMDNRILIPKVLLPYMNGLTHIDFNV